MSDTVLAAVVDSGGQAPSIQPITLADLDHDEVRVRVVATGVCHTDVAWASGELWDNFPVVLGHESAGIVEAVGSAVSRVKPGDRVALALAHHCGHCNYCESARPMLCGQRVEAKPRSPARRRGADPGLRHRRILGVDDRARGVDHSAARRRADGRGRGGRAARRRPALGAVFNIAEVEYGSTVAILGAGGIGLNLVMGCLIAGAGRIVVADPNPERRALATRFGATDVCESSEDALRQLEPDGFEYVFESAGFPEPMALAVRMTARGGTATIIGAATPDAELRINALDFVPSQRRILGCLTGNVRPNVDFPRYFRIYQRGLLDLDSLITATVPFDDIATGFEMNRTAQGIRTVVHHHRRVTNSGGSCSN